MFFIIFFTIRLEVLQNQLQDRGEPELFHQSYVEIGILANKFMLSGDLIAKQ